MRNTARALRASASRSAPGAPSRSPVAGAGLGGWREPAGVLDFGNSGTGIRLMAGLLAAHPFFSVLTGDRYLRRRPMRRVAEPLRLMGARIAGRARGTLAPLAIEGTRLAGIAYRSPVSSAQVKSALLLAGLLAAGETSVVEPELSRDHTERMLRHLGVGCASTAPRSASRAPAPGPRATSPSRRPLLGGVPARGGGDLPGAEVTVRNVCVNPTRTGFFEVLRAMGAAAPAGGARSAASRSPT